MIDRRVFRTLILFFAVVIFPAAPAAASEQPILFSKESRVMIIAPHPDDETLGAGGVIQSALAAGSKVKLVYLTHGDYNELSSIMYKKWPLFTTADFIKSGQRRKIEAVAAMSFLGLTEKDLIFLGYPDLGTLSIWHRHWGETKPFRSFITRINKVPYKDDYGYGQPYRGDNVVSDFEKILLSFKPTHIFVTPPFDLNSDHRAAYLYLRVALLNVEGRLERPKVYGYLIHAHRWPTPRKYKPVEGLKPPARISIGKDSKWIIYAINNQEFLKKKEALLKYQSQIAYSKDFMLSFVRTNELFLDMPVEDIPLQPMNDRTTSFGGSYWLQDEKLWVDIHVSSPLDTLGMMTMEVFSYRQGANFSTMPKINLRLLGKQLFTRDGRRRVGGIEYRLAKKSLLVGIPLTILKSPDIIFVSVQTSKSELSLDFGSWRVLKVNKAA